MIIIVSSLTPLSREIAVYESILTAKGIAPGCVYRENGVVGVAQDVGRAFACGDFFDRHLAERLSGGGGDGAAEADQRDDDAPPPCSDAHASPFMSSVLNEG